MDNKNKASSWSWNIEPDELKNQIDNYDKLKISESYKGISVLLVGGLLILSLILGYFEIVSISDVVYSLFIYIPVLFFVYKGHRWAIISLLVLWTIEKVFTLYMSVENGGGVWGSIIWWLIVTPYIYRALLVENEKCKNKKNKSDIISEGSFCSKCGEKLKDEAKFCGRCGNKINL
jgi:hypothetical protein